MREQMRDKLIAAYLDYLNNYITIAVYAEHNGLTEVQAEVLIGLARDVANTPHPES